ncbi:L-Ala-D/L-Glu epimerase [Variovorax sp. SRS16]|uniref:mandelate racemase/muconate lactonizing enzyme family protein n=1 Tax=Variovorax sp. SRS16 TaxID=282217 RepID=UPI0013186EFD|nr:mandelate racemase/muconate lactonizing enzyme family protein [Variovorax sp. SRS16]VTU32379.1 L-Ala-D/L-Glu epimerase [Variovorax sp. SRS16]
MKIERIEVFGVAIPLFEPRTVSYTRHAVQRSAIVRIRTDDGTVGLGNVDPFPGYSAHSVDETIEALTARIGPLVMGHDPRDLNALIDRLDSKIGGFLDAQAAIEMACIDLAARASNMPVHRYLGGALRPAFRLNGWIGMVSPQEAAAQAAGWKERNFRSLKIKAGSGVEADVERIKAVRETVGSDFGLRVDANSAYSTDDAIALSRRIAPLSIELLEQPVHEDDLEGMARVRKEGGGVPVMADESVRDGRSIIDILKADAADLVKVKVMKQGGIVRTRQVLAICEAAGIRCVIGHGFGLAINTAAEVSVAAVTRNIVDGLECVGALNVSDDIVEKTLRSRGGQIDLPDGPGFGLSLDMTKIQKYRFN